MALKRTKTSIKQAAVRKLQPSYTTKGAVEKLQKITTYLNKRFVGRSEVINAMIVSIINRSHVMLEGPPGVAKSMLVNDFFGFIIEGNYYQKMMMKGTQPEELFGPLNLPQYRENGVWEHNTEGYLVEAHFAFIDEVYRASDMLLPSTLNILNERIFINGTETVNCPLRCAIGTTNFKTEDERLAAFHDRWLIRMDVKPLISAADLHKMLRSYSADEALQKPQPITLQELDLLHDAVDELELEDSILKMYSSICTKLRKEMSKDSNFFLSDRRIYQAFRLAGVNAVLNSRTEITYDDLFSTGMGLIEANNMQQQSALVGIMSSELQEMRDLTADEELVNRIKTKLNSETDKFDESMSHEDAKQLYMRLGEWHKSLTSASHSEMPKTRDWINAYGQLIDHCSSTLADVNCVLSKYSSAEFIVE